MKILLDACVWGKAKERLAQEGHDVVWAGDWQEDPGDLEILKRAHITQMEEGSPPTARKMEDTARINRIKSVRDLDIGITPMAEACAII